MSIIINHIPLFSLLILSKFKDEVESSLKAELYPMAFVCLKAISSTLKEDDTKDRSDLKAFIAKHGDIKSFFESSETSNSTRAALFTSLKTNPSPLIQEVLDILRAELLCITSVAINAFCALTFSIGGVILDSTSVLDSRIENINKLDKKDSLHLSESTLISLSHVLMVLHKLYPKCSSIRSAFDSLQELCRTSDQKKVCYRIIKAK